MDEWIKSYRDGFPFGYTELTQAGQVPCDTGISFGILRLKADEEWSYCASEEAAFLHLEGRIEVEVDAQAYENERRSLFDEGPFCWHVGPSTSVVVRAQSDAEIAVFRTANASSFKSRVYKPEDVPNEPRGAGQVGGACTRWVRTIFDGSSTDPQCQLVLGEVINMPGKWSSYPPHHHPQPEIYHYRFTDPRGFGHAELGESVMKVRAYDTVKILDEKDHAQCAAPGYAMYYIWVIRHLPENRYTVPEFSPEHTWTMEPGVAYWNATEEIPR